jgi:pyrroline-5-carboxylate reductase
MESHKICFLGAGVMARAIISGMVESGTVAAGQIYASVRSAKSKAELDALFAGALHATTDNVAAISACSIVIVGCLSFARADKESLPLT